MLAIEAVKIKAGHLKQNSENDLLDIHVIVFENDYYQLYEDLKQKFCLENEENKLIKINNLRGFLELFQHQHENELTSEQLYRLQKEVNYWSTSKKDLKAYLEIVGEIFNKSGKNHIGKKHALKEYDQFALNTSCFWGSTGSNITPVVQFHEIFVTKIMNKLIYYYC